MKYRGGKFAEVWFKPEGDPCGLTFRIPQEAFQVPGMDRQLTIENLLKALAIAPEEVEWWRHGDVSHPGMNGSSPEFKSALPPPPQHDAHLDIYVRLNPPLPADASVPTPSATAEEAGESVELQISPALWQEFEARWKAILGIEAIMDALRISMEGLLKEMEASFKKTLNMEEKVHALRADVGRWEQAKKRIPFAMPKMKDYIHRSVWALGLPERKRLEELHRDHIQPQIPFPRMDEVSKLLEELLKARQILSAKGNSVCQECKAIAAEVQRALQTLQGNALANAQRKRDAAKGGRFFKEVRKWSGA